MLTDKQVTKLIRDTRKMTKEFLQIAGNDQDPWRRQAARWLSTLQGITTYAVQCRDNARRGR